MDGRTYGHPFVWSVGPKKWKEKETLQRRGRGNLRTRSPLSAGYGWEEKGAEQLTARAHSTPSVKSGVECLTC